MRPENPRSVRWLRLYNNHKLAQAVAPAMSHPQRTPLSLSVGPTRSHRHPFSHHAICLVVGKPIDRASLHRYIRSRWGATVPFVPVGSRQSVYTYFSTVAMYTFCIFHFAMS